MKKNNKPEVQAGNNVIQKELHAKKRKVRLPWQLWCSLCLQLPRQSWPPRLLSLC